MKNHNGDNTTREDEAAQLTAYALGQLSADELAAMKANPTASGDDAAQSELREIEAIGAALATARNAEPLPPTSSKLRKAIEQQFAEPVSKQLDVEGVERPRRHRSFRHVVMACLAVAACLMAVALLLPAVQSSRESARRVAAMNELREIELHNHHDTFSPTPGEPAEVAVPPYVGISGATNHMRNRVAAEAKFLEKRLADAGRGEAIDRLNDLELETQPRTIVQQEERAQGLESKRINDSLSVDAPSQRVADNSAFRERVLDEYVTTPGTVLTKEGQGQRGGQSDPAHLANKAPGVGGRGKYAGRMPGGYGGGMPDGTGGGDGGYGGEQRVLGRSEGDRLTRDNSSSLGLAERQAAAEHQAALAQAANVAELEVAENAIALSKADLDATIEIRKRSESEHRKTAFSYGKSLKSLRQTGEQYEPIVENAYLSPLRQPLSTFSIDVDTASYANVRRFLTSGRLPPPNSVRIEELVNYFRYDYPQPKGDSPFAVHMEVAECPWNEGHWLLKVGLKGKEVQRSERPASNLVFLLDVSGSMADQNKLPLLKTAMKLLVGELGENDRVSIVTYAGEAGLRLPPTRGHEQQKISGVIDSLSAGGSTNGSAGINLAYEQAAAYFVPGGTNRVILCTDGDLNVGITSDDALVKLIKQKATGGTFLTVLGFGEGNLKDAKMEKLADNGNGLYAYIDSVREARKVLVEQLTGSTITIAKDVKIQIEFNPAQIAAYRLLGYENRVLAAQDFNNDKKDAGEIGAGHTVTALYELVPVEAATREPAESRPGVDPLKYQQPGANLLPEQRGQQFDTSRPGPGLVPANGDGSGELLTLKLRYKQPEGETSKLLEYPLKDKAHSFNSASPDLQLAAAVASFGMILRGSEHRGTSNLAAAAEIASGALGEDAGGYRAEFLDMVRKAQALGAR